MLPIPMLLHCPMCGDRHIDEGDFAKKPHKSHACQSCGHVWRPAIVPTVGVKFLPGFRNGDPEPVPSLLTLDLICEVEKHASLVDINLETDEDYILVVQALAEAATPKPKRRAKKPKKKSRRK